MGKSPVYGMKCTGLLGNYDPKSQSLKTRQRLLFEDCLESLESLPKSGMLANGELFELMNSDCLIDELDVFLLPTPTKTGTDHRQRYAQGGRSITRYCIEKELIGKDELLSPEFLEEIIGFPIGWTE